MSIDTLFQLPPEGRDRLAEARRGLARAEAELDRAEASDEEFDGFGIVPDELREAVRSALHELRLAENERLHRK